MFLSAIQKGGNYLAPYIDYGNDNDSTNQRGSIKTLDGKDYIIVGHGDEFQLNQTDGYADDSHKLTCDDCDDRCAEDDVVYSEFHDRSICEDCQDNYYYAYTSRGNHDYVHSDSVVQVRDEYYAEDCLDQFDIYQCEESGAYYPSDELFSTLQGLIHESYCLPIDHEDQDGNDYAHRDDVATLSDGSTCHQDDFTTLQDELEEEEKEGIIIESSYPNQSTEKDQPNE